MMHVVHIGHETCITSNELESQLGGPVDWDGDEPNHHQTAHDYGFTLYTDGFDYYYIPLDTEPPAGLNKA